jgi:hypothetical protein
MIRSGPLETAHDCRALGHNCRALEIRVDERDRLILVAGHEVTIAVERNLDRAVSEYVESAFALTPAAIKIDAKVWRPSCNPIGESPAAFHAFSARATSPSRLNGREPC